MFFHCHSFGWDRRIDGPGCQVVWNLAFIVYATFRKRCLGRNWQQNPLKVKLDPQQNWSNWIQIKHHVLFWVLNKQKLASKIHISQTKKTHREWLTGVFFLTPKKSIPRRRRVDVVGPDVWCVTWLSRRERYLIQQSILGALEVSRFSNLLPRYSTLEEPPEDTMGWRTHPKKFGGKPDDLIFLGGLVGFGFVAGKKKWEGFKLTEDIFFFGTKLFLSFLWQMGSFLKNKCVV